MPENYPISIAYIEELTTNKALIKAKQVSQQTITLHDGNPRLYRLLSKIEQLAGRKAESHRMLAEAYVATGELHPAIQQLEIALKEAEAEQGDFYQTSKIESRLKMLRKQVTKEHEEGQGKP